MHAVALARELRVPRVIVPVHSAVFSALGMLLTDLRRDYVQTHLLSLEPATASAISRQFASMEIEARMNFISDGIALKEGALSCEYLLDMRYQGQEHTVKIAARLDSQCGDIGQIADSFHEAHEKRYTYRLPNPIQIVNFHLVACVAVAKPDLPRKAPTGKCVEQTVLGTRQVDFDADGVHMATIYAGALLEPGMELAGPAVVQEPVVTLLVPPGNRVSIDEFGSYHVHIGQ